MPATRDHDAHLTHLLQHAKLRVTGVRLDLLRILASSTSALPAIDIVAALPKADRVTVYRTLNALVEAGIAHKVDPGDRIFRFKLTDHAHCEGDHHDHEHPHLVCDACGSVQCLDDAVVTIEPRKGSAGRWQNIRQQDVTLHGTCGKCDEKPAGKSAQPAQRSRHKH